MKKSNILVLMVDQLNGTFFPDGPAEFLHAPNLRKLAERSARFANCYTASPLCAPARASFMSGQLPSRTGVYDNAAEFSSEIPTYAHHLRNAGYQTALSGKMHFVGPDQLHGFEQRLTTDIYPADLAGHLTIASPANALIGGIITSVRSLVQDRQKLPINSNMTTRSPIRQKPSSTISLAVMMNAPGV